MSDEMVKGQRRDAKVYELIAGGARTKLLESMMELRLPEVIAEKEDWSSEELAKRLSFDPLRTWKYLHLLHLVGILDEKRPEVHSTESTRFSLSAEGKAIFGEKGDKYWYYEELVKYWQWVASFSTTQVLRGLPLTDSVRWPPRDLSAATHLESWMRNTATQIIDNLEDVLDFSKISSVLDMGGGDATMAIAFAAKFPHLKYTVFNLPASAYLARENVSYHKLGDKITVHEGDFVNDQSYPDGHELILWSRVMSDWTGDLCESFIQKSREALGPNGKLVIAEPLVDHNLDLSISWEFRYLHYDDFGKACYKTTSEYTSMLEKNGFKVVKTTPPNEDSIYSVIEAEPA